MAPELWPSELAPRAEDDLNAFFLNLQRKTVSGFVPASGLL